MAFLEVSTFQGILAAATILGGASAVWYFRNELLTWWNSRKPKAAAPAPLAQNPSKERLVDAIMQSDPRVDWNHANSNARSVASFRYDANFRLVMEHSEEGIQNDNFREPWANRHPHADATGYWCDLFYGATLIERFILVGVDGGRALIPVPREGDVVGHPDVIRRLDYQVARVFDTLGTLDDYIRRSGLSVK